jgi:HPt (histidine-containing phosphotransfer) domain-containing protein
LATPKPDPATVCDLDSALSAVEGDRELLRRMTGLFLTQLPALLGDIRTAVAAIDGAGLERAAHKLRGGAVNFGARRACDAALDLERMGRAGDLSRAPRIVAELELATAALEDVLVEFRDGGQ